MVTSRVTTAGKNISEWGYIVPCNAQHEWFYLVSIDVYRWLFTISYGGIAKETANLSDLVGGTAGPKSLADGVFLEICNPCIYSFWSGLLESFTERLLALGAWFILPVTSLCLS